MFGKCNQSGSFTIQRDAHVQPRSADYCCPFCLLAQTTPSSWTTLDDIVLKDEQVLAFVSPTSWPNNPGHVVVVIPIQHFENIYDLPVEMGGVLHAATRTVALA